MNSWIALLRGVNVVGRNQISMQALREICMSLKLRNPRTYIQSGNVVFVSAETDATKLATRLESAIEKRCGFRPSVMMRTAAEMRDIVSRNPYAARGDIDPGKFAVFFMATQPHPELCNKVMAINVGKEEIRADGRELYIYFPDGQGRSKLPPVLERTLKMPATARNWNTVNKLLAMAEDSESAR